MMGMGTLTHSNKHAESNSYAYSSSQAEQCQSWKFRDATWIAWWYDLGDIWCVLFLCLGGWLNYKLINQSVNHILNIYLFWLIVLLINKKSFMQFVVIIPLMSIWFINFIFNTRVLRTTLVLLFSFDFTSTICFPPCTTFSALYLTLNQVISPATNL